MRKILVFLLFSVSALAKTVHAPLPPEAYAAKTIAIVNHAGSQRLTDKAYEELQKWGHFTVVQDSASADMVLVLTTNTHSTGASTYTNGSNTSISEDTVLDVTTSFILKNRKSLHTPQKRNPAWDRRAKEAAGRETCALKLEFNS